VGERPDGIDKGEALVLFSRKLRELREALGLTQEGLGQLAGVDRTFVTALETGKRNPSFWTIVRVATGLDVEPGTLLDGMRARVD
jgi:transcriptional regulator with XRE-family HTH domain